MIHLGIVGAGAAVRQLHLPVLQELKSEVQIAAIASRTVQSAQTLAEQIGSVRIFNNYREMVCDPGIDAVLIAVPIEFNAAVLIDTVKAGKHALAEKPLAATRVEARQVLKACSSAKSVVAIGENFRYRSDLTRAREMILERRIGELFAFQVQVCLDLDAKQRDIWTQAGWRRTPRHPGGFLLDAGVHAVAGLREVLGEISALSAQILDIHPQIKGPDNLLMQLTLKNGAIGHLFASYTAKVANETLFAIDAYGTEGNLQLSDGRVTLYRRNSNETFNYFEENFDKGYRAQWLNFVRSVQGREPCRSTPEQAYLDLLVIDAALRSAHLKSFVRLP
jgi:predicted dehydrogenase